MMETMVDMTMMTEMMVIVAIMTITVLKETPFSTIDGITVDKKKHVLWC